MKELFSEYLEWVKEQSERELEFEERFEEKGVKMILRFYDKDIQVHRGAVDLFSVLGVSYETQNRYLNGESGDFPEEIVGFIDGIKIFELIND